MKKISLNRGWTVRRLDGDETPRPVDVPHDAMIDSPEGGDFEYVRTLAVPQEWQGMKAVLEFEGVYRNAEVYINGEKAAFRPYGYANFYVKAEEFLRFGADNALRVIARNGDMPNCRWYTGAGIHRPVNLWLGGAEHIRLNGVRIRTLNPQNGEIQVLVKLSRPGKIIVDIMDGDATVASRCHVSKKRSVLFRMTVPDPILWEPEQPYLYTARVSFGDDLVEVPFGIRALRWSHAEGLALNGRRVILRGACVYPGNGPLGACAFPEAEERKVRLLKACGYNAIRSAHCPCSKALLDACDRLGMLVLDEYADGWYMPKTPRDYTGALGDWWQDDLKDMVDKDFNHPSVIMYSTGNDVIETARPRGAQFAGEMARYLRELDDSRPSTCAVNPFFNLLTALGFDLYGVNAKKPGEPLYRRLSGAMAFGAALPFCGWKTRDAYAHMDIAGYNFGLRRFEKDLRKYPERLILGTASSPADAWRLRELAEAHTRIVGDFAQAGIDDLCGEGAAARGCVDITGRHRAAAAYTRVALGLQDGPVIAVQPPNSGDGARAVESWSWQGCEGKTAVVEVYARAAQVELKLNGVSHARKKVDRTCRALFNVAYAPGTLTAQAFDAAGEAIGTCSLTSATRETELRLYPETDAVTPGGLCFVRLRFTDENGVWKPTERRALTAEVENGTLAALGCAGSQTWGGTSTDTFDGEALAIVRAGESGTVTLNVSAGEDLSATVAIPIDDGLIVMPVEPREETRVVIPITLGKFAHSEEQN